MARRIEGVDVARGVASLIMIQGHAYDGWVAPEHKDSAAYLFTRLLGSLPLPAFLVLAGAAIVLRVEASIRRREAARAVRRKLIVRGLAVIGWGYLASLGYALIDGADGLDTILRADVLHAIGLSIVALAALGLGGTTMADRRRLAVAAGALLLVPTALCPWLSPLGAHLEGPLRYLLALFVDVPGVTLMPFVPLAAWLGLGALVCLAMRRVQCEGHAAALAGAPIQWLLRLALSALVAALVADWATDAWLARDGSSLTRGHPAVWLNVVDLGARGVLVLALAAAASPWLPARARGVLVQLGRGSLLAYVLHIPFCYGRLGAPVRGELDVAEATPLVAALMAVSYLAVWLRDRWRSRAPSG